AGRGRLCGVCCRPINDRFLLKIMDISYHEECVQCCTCGDQLHHTCFVKDSKLYCRLDYDRTDYEKEVEMMQGFGYGEFICDDLLQSNRSHDGRRGPKRPRTILTTQQRRAFKASFEVSPKPCRKIRETLAKDTGLSVRIVQTHILPFHSELTGSFRQVWFQNQRAKMKKIQKKARQDNKASKDVENDEKKLNVKEEEQSLDVNKRQDEGYMRLSFPSSLDSGQPSLFLSPPAAHQNPPQTMAGINPIDRLYSMQNSYFCGDEQMES
ncbi:hypothetical protein NQ317_017535, partial [Molorchus minor]